MALSKYGWWLDGHPSGALVAASSGATLSAGTWYWECKITCGDATATGSGGMACGVAGSTAILVDTVDSSVNAAQANCAQTNFIDMIVDAAAPPAAWGYPARPGPGGFGALVQNTVYGFALDTPNQKIWWVNVSRTTGTWNATTGWPNGGGGDFSTGGASPITGSIYILVGATMGVTLPGTGTINFGATAFTVSPPSGYNSIESGFTGAIINPNDNSNLVLSGGNLSFSGIHVTPNGLGNFNCARSRFSVARS